MLLLMMLIYVMRLIILMLFSNRPAGDQCGPHERPGACGNHVGDPWSTVKHLT